MIQGNFPVIFTNSVKMENLFLKMVIMQAQRKSSTNACMVESPSAGTCTLYQKLTPHTFDFILFPKIL